MVELAALIIGAVTTLLIALFVLAKNNHSITNRLFVGLALGLVGWSITTYLSLHVDQQHTLFWIRWIMFFVVIQNTSFWLLVRTFPANQFNLRRKRYIWALGYSALVAAVTVSPFLFVDFDTSPVPGPGMALFMPHALIFAVGGLVSLIIRFRKSRGVEHEQLLYFLLGTLLMFTVVPVGNFVLPLAFKFNALVPFSSLYAIIFSGLIAYGIVAKKLFDIRAAVARSVAYLLSLGFIAVVYGAFLTAFTLLIDLQQEEVLLERVIYIGFALLTSVLFPPVKKFFARATNKFFYQDAYDTETFLDQLNGVLTSTLELEILLRKSSQIIEQNIKSSFAQFKIKNGDSYKTLGSQGRRPVATDKLIDLEAQLKQRIVVTEDLHEKHQHIRSTLSDEDVAVVVKLTSNMATSDGVGYLLLGHKSSGNIYSRQDLRNIDIIADELVIAIQNALRFEEIEQFNATLQQKVNDATRQLRRTNEKLKALDETKDEFISMASHQLRTPLTSVKGYMSMVLEGDAGKLTGAQKKLLDQAFASSQRMVYLIADLLNVSRLRTGKFVIEPVESNLADVVDGEVDQLIETAKGRELTLTYEKPADFPILYLDETKIRQVIMNFIDNAIYYTPAGGKIDVKLQEIGESIEFTVTDNGLGVPKTDQHHLFSKFYRAGNARKARPDGTGLGLFMAKKVIVTQGGSIIFKSQEGKGSTFGFTFAKSKLKLPAKP